MKSHSPNKSVPSKSVMLPVMPPAQSAHAARFARFIDAPVAVMSQVMSSAMRAFSAFAIALGIGVIGISAFSSSAFAQATADAGRNQIAFSGDMVTLDGTGSSHYMGNNGQHIWQPPRESRGTTAGCEVSLPLSQSQNIDPIFTVPPDCVGVMIWTLEIDSVAHGALNVEATDTVTITVVDGTAVADPAVCTRTQRVRAVILTELSLTDCTGITHAQLAGLGGAGEGFTVENHSDLTELQSGDFNGLHNYEGFLIAGNQLTTIPADLFDFILEAAGNLGGLKTISFRDNPLVTLPLPQATYDALRAIDGEFSLRLPPLPPVNLTAARSNTDVDLTWETPYRDLDGQVSSTPAEIQGWKIESSPDGSDGSWVEVEAEIGGTPTVLYTHANSVHNFYRMAAKVNDEFGAYSATVEASGGFPPAVAAGLTASGGRGSVMLSWSAPSIAAGNTIVGYQIQSSTDGGNTFTDLEDDTGNTDTTYTHADADPDDYHYRVAIIIRDSADAVSTGDFSNVAMATVLPDSDVPTNLTATGSEAMAMLSWLAPSVADGSMIVGYQIQSSTDGGNTFTDLEDDTGNTDTTYTHRTAAPGTYHYRVAALLRDSANEDSTSGFSAVATATIRAIPAFPTNLTATGGRASVSLSWTAPTITGTITGYRVQASTDGSEFTDLEDDTGTDNTTYTHTYPAEGPFGMQYFRVATHIEDADNNAVQSEFSAVATTIVFDPETTTDICGRSDKIEAAILSEIASQFNIEAPPCFGVGDTMLSGLLSLDVSNMEIADDEIVAGDFADLVGLTVLVLDGNDFTTVDPMLFAGLSGLRHLSISGGEVATITANSFAGLQGLVALDLSENNLSTLSADVFGGLTVMDMNALQTLILRGNSNLQALPAAIFNSLTNLRVLDLSDADLGGGGNAVPDALIAQLAALSDLNLSGNANLTALHGDFFQANTNLRSLNLGGIGITALTTSWFESLAGLRSLGLAGLPLTELPTAVVMALPNLEALDLSGTNINNLTAADITPLASLTSLALPPQPVSNVVAVDNTDGTFTLTWTPPVVNRGDFPPHEIIGHRIELSTDDGATYNLLESDNRNGEPRHVHVETGSLNRVDNYRYRVSPRIRIDGVIAFSQGAVSGEVTVPSVAGFCERTAGIRDAIVAAVDGVDNCAQITRAHLASLTALDARNRNIASLSPGDFLGLVELADLDLRNNDMTSVPRGIFSVLTLLVNLHHDLFAPESLTASAGFNSIVLNWSAPTSTGLGTGAAPVQNYRLLISESGDDDDFTPFQVLGTDQFTFTHIGLDRGTTRHYRLAAIGEANLASTDLEVSATTRTTAETLNQAVLPHVARAITAANGVITSRIQQAGSGFDVPRFNFGGHAVGNANFGGEFGAQLLSAAEQERDIKDVLANSEFVLPWHAHGDGAYRGGHAFWGGGDHRSISSETDVLDWDGDVSAYHLGIDSRMGGGVVAGFAVSSITADLEYQSTENDIGEGLYDVSMTTITPYLGWSFENAGLWANFGIGDGELELTQLMSQAAGGSQISRSDLSLRSLTIGGEGVSVTGGGGALTYKAEISQTELEIERTETTDASEVAAGRTRLAVQYSNFRNIVGGSVFEPSVEIAARFDRGDGEAGGGGELGGGMKYHSPGKRFIAEISARGLVNYNGDYDEWGIQGSVRLQPGLDGQGFSFDVRPAYGDNGSRFAQLWRHGLDDDAANTADYAMRLNARLGYGLSLREMLVTPYSEMSLGNIDTYSLGVNWDGGNRVDVDLVGERREDAENSVLLKGNLSF